MPTNHYPTPMATGDQANTGMVPESAINKVRQAYHEQGLEITQEQAQRDLIKAVNLVKLVLNHAAKNGTLASYYKEASHD